MPETNGIYGVNPQLTNPAMSDYHITDRRPAAGGGQSPARLPGDYEGDCYLDPPSIGAFEIPSKVGGQGDINNDGKVNVDDLLIVINAWGPCDPRPQLCVADIAPPPDGDGVVDVDDLLLVINNWTVV